MKINYTTLPPNNENLETVVIPPEEIFHSCYESEGFVKFQYTVDDLLLAASTAATVFNFLVVFCAFKLFKRSGDTMHLFIINMTLGDLVLTVFSLPNEFLIRKHTFLRHIHLCALIHFCNWLGLAVSGLSLTLLNVDKLIYFRWPMRYDQTMSKRRAAVLCIFIWGVSFGFVSYVWIFDIVYATPDCMLQMTDVKKYYYEIFMIMFCVLPVTSSLFLSTYLFRLTRQKRHAPARSDGAHVDIRTFKNKVRSLVFIFATTAWTSFSLLPYRIFNICRIHLFDWNSIACEQRVVMNWLAWLLIYLLTLNPIVNPLITSIIYAPYRMTLKKLLINIPIGNRLQYTYRGDTTETSYLSVRRTRVRCDATGSHSQAPAHELTQLNASSPPQQLLENRTRGGVPKMSGCGTNSCSPLAGCIARHPSQSYAATAHSQQAEGDKAEEAVVLLVTDDKRDGVSRVNLTGSSDSCMGSQQRFDSIGGEVSSAESDSFVKVDTLVDTSNASTLPKRHRRQRRNEVSSAKSCWPNFGNPDGEFLGIRFGDVNTYIDDSASDALSPSPECDKKILFWPLERVSPTPGTPLPAAAHWSEKKADDKVNVGGIAVTIDERRAGRKANRIFMRNCSIK